MLINVVALLRILLGMFNTVYYYYYISSICNPSTSNKGRMQIIYDKGGFMLCKLNIVCNKYVCVCVRACILHFKIMIYHLKGDH